MYHFLLIVESSNKQAVKYKHVDCITNAHFIYLAQADLFMAHQFLANNNSDQQNLVLCFYVRQSSFFLKTSLYNLRDGIN